MRFSFLFFFKQKTAYEMRISDWSSDVCSSDLKRCSSVRSTTRLRSASRPSACTFTMISTMRCATACMRLPDVRRLATARSRKHSSGRCRTRRSIGRSEEHTSELQSLMRISYAVFCLKKKKKKKNKKKHKTNENRSQTN